MKTTVKIIIGIAIVLFTIVVPSILLVSYFGDSLWTYLWILISVWVGTHFEKWIGYLTNYLFSTSGKPAASDQRRAPVHEKHIAPEYYGFYQYPQYKGFVTVNKCTECHTVGLSEDFHTINPCRNCGGEVKEAEPAAWMYKDGERGWLDRNGNFL